MKFSSNKHRELKNLKEDLQITDELLLHAVESGLLKIAINLPLRWFERSKLENYDLLDGLARIHSRDALAILKSDSKRIELQRFRLIKQDEPIRLLDKPPQQPVFGEKKHLLVIEEDEKEFKHLCKNDPSLLGFDFQKNYRYVTVKGKKYNLPGVVQRKIIKELHEALLNSDDYDESWVVGKMLIDKAESQADYVRDVFSNKVIREKLIESDGDGLYRLNLPL